MHLQSSSILKLSPIFRCFWRKTDLSFMEKRMTFNPSLTLTGYSVDKNPVQDTSPTRYQTTKIFLLLLFFLTKSTLANRCMGDTFSSMPRPKRSTTPSPAPPSPSPSTSATSTAPSKEGTTRRKRSEVSDEEEADRVGPSKRAVTTQPGTSAESFYGSGRGRYKVC